MTDFFASEVMRPALLPSLLIAVVAASMSVMVLAHRLAFLAVGVSHATLAGLGLAVWLALPLLPTATVVAIAVALLLTPMPRRAGISEDTGAGILFAAAMALGVVLLTTAPKYEVDLFGLLFGNILTISSAESRWLIIVACTVLASLLLAARNWWSLAFDATTAAAGGMAVGPYRLWLHALVGLTVIMGVKLAGIILTTGLMVLPAACAWLWARGLVRLWLASVACAVIATLAGLMLSYAWDWPAGATVVLLLGLMFVLSWGGSWLRTNGLRASRRG